MGTGKSRCGFCSHNGVFPFAIQYRHQLRTLAVSGLDRNWLLDGSFLGL
jgi:hypothetical protein